MSNRDIHIANQYHEATKLFYLNLQSKPSGSKRYTALSPVPLPTDFALPAVSTLEAVAGTIPPASPPQTLDLMSLAALLFFSAGRIRTRHFATAGEVTFRAAASAGGLYPIEVYVVCGDLPGLEAGVYHFSPMDFALRGLRQGDYRGTLAQAAAGDSATAAAPATLVCTAIPSILDSPLDRQLEVAELGIRDDVSARADAREQAILDGPATRQIRAVVSAPAVQRLSVEKK